MILHLSLLAHCATKDKDDEDATRLDEEDSPAARPCRRGVLEYISALDEAFVGVCCVVPPRSAISGRRECVARRGHPLVRVVVASSYQNSVPIHLTKPQHDTQTRLNV